jgi:hypothetical protein
MKIDRANVAALRMAVVETLECRQLMSATATAVRSYDGTGNNLAHPDWGSTGEQLLRLAAAAYGDGVSSMAGDSRPSARVVSNTVAAHGAGEIENARRLSAFAYLWGQFIDHDLDLSSDSALSAESANVPVPAGDAYFDPAGTGTQVIGFQRSGWADGTGVTTPRQQVNDITAFLDGSMIYGSDAARAKALRTGVGGRLKTSAGNMLPFNNMGLDNDTVGAPADSYYAAGDVRANENVELTAMQTLFVREHNRLAAQVAKQNPRWADEQVYQKARSLVIAEIQAITYNEFLPALLGAGAIRAYAGYKPGVNPDISNEFSTAAYRIGHSMLPDDVEFLDNDGNPVRDALPLAQAFFNPSLLGQTGLDPLMKYLASSNAEEVDTKVVDGLRNFLFGQPGAGGLDLAALNIQRGRDHGLADYNSTRAAIGLPRVTGFAQITSDPVLQARLQSLYGSVNDIDLWVGGLAEDHVPGSSVGPTFQRILVDQFTRVRDGDRFWYQRDLSPADLKLVEGTRLADVIRRNTGVTDLQDNVFVFDVAIDGRVWNDRNADGRIQQNGEPGVGGVLVSLLDDDGNVLQATRTTPDGRYHFAGLDLGAYRVRVEPSDGWRATTRQQSSLVATRGQRFSNVSFGQLRIAAPAQPQQPPPPPPPATQPPPPAVPAHSPGVTRDVLATGHRPLRAILA